MIKEFAVDPEALANWEDCRFITSLFGAGNGRVISNYPKRWKRMAFDAATKVASTMDRKRIEVRLARLDKTVLLQGGRPAGESDQWLDNALAEHKRLPFSSIISMETKDDIIAISDIDETIEPFAVTRGITIERNAEAMVDAINIIFQAGTHYKFIDPFFTPTRNHIRPLKCFIERISSRKVSSKGVIIEIVSKAEENAEDDERFEHNIRASVEDFLPEDMELKISLFPEARMHDRWVLSDWCGVSFGHGFGEGGNRPTVNLLLLDEATRRQHWNEFSR